MNELRIIFVLLKIQLFADNQLTLLIIRKSASTCNYYAFSILKRAYSGSKQFYYTFYISYKRIYCNKIYSYLLLSLINFFK